MLIPRIVVLTPSQLSSIDDETLELYDRPEYTTHLSKKQIQELSNRLVSRKAREKWIIGDILLSRIHESTVCAWKTKIPYSMSSSLI